MINTITSTPYTAQSGRVGGSRPTQTTGAAVLQTTRLSAKDSTVTAYKNRHPGDAANVDRMVAAGKNVLAANGARDVDVTSMSMSEYKAHIAKLLDSIPFDASRPFDEETIHISEAGWEQMKKDPEYEAWVLGYTKINRSVRNPFAGLSFGAASSYCIENFGASIEEHAGYAFSKTYGGTAAGARQMFELRSRGGFMTKRAPQADQYPPKDYDLRRQRERAHRKKKEQEAYEDALFEKKQMGMAWQRKTQARDLFLVASNGSYSSSFIGHVWTEQEM